MILDGKQIANEIQDEIEHKVRVLTGRPPSLAVVLVGENPASRVYVSKKAKTCEEVGIHSIKIELSAAIKEDELLSHIHALNADPHVDGILVQLPLPKQINPAAVISAITPEKDVDGFHPINIGKLVTEQQDGFTPCTPLGIQEMMIRRGINTSGKHAVIVGRSLIVGKPMALLLLQNRPCGNATVSVVHSKTKDLPAITRTADILITAVGSPHFIREDMVKEGAVVIDVGINRVEDPAKESGFKLVGDVDFDRVEEKCAWITPVPGGVGPMTIAMLLSNTLLSYCRREGLTL